MTEEQRKSWLGRVKTIRKSALKLMCEMMVVEETPVGNEPMMPSDWADNIVTQAEELEEMLSKPMKGKT